jgi:ABC-type antimicrobial peptide transport system permease subunit
VWGAATLEEAMRRHAAPLRWFALALALLAGAATLGAAGGLYGMMSFSVARRTRELGVRAALGAAPGRLLRQVLGEGVRLAAAGAVAGGIGALTVGRLLQERFQGVDPLDGGTYLAVAAALAAVTVAASAVPALRASRLDAAEALRAG